MDFKHDKKLLAEAMSKGYKTIGEFALFLKSISGNKAETKGY